MCIVNKINQDESGDVCLQKRWRQLADGLAGHKHVHITEAINSCQIDFASKEGRVVSLTVRSMRRDALEDAVWLDIRFSGYVVAAMSDIADIDTWIRTAKAILDAFGVEKVEVGDGEK